MSLGEDLMKPTAMLYRNLVAMEVEEYLRAYPLDGVVLLANCDKSVPSAIMGAVSADLPALVLTAGPRPVSSFHGRRVGTGTDLWRAFDAHRSGAMNDAEWHEFEGCLVCGQGSCNTMGTASSMAIVTELLGMMLPGGAAIPATDPARAVDRARDRHAHRRDGARPGAALGCAHRRRLPKRRPGAERRRRFHQRRAAPAGDRRPGRPCRSRSSDIGRLSRSVPVVADVEPSGELLMQDFFAAGGVPALVAELAERVRAGRGHRIGPKLGRGERRRDRCRAPPSVRSARRSPSDGAFAVVRGSLAPDGGLLKTSAASPRLFRHRGPAVVFSSYDEMRERIDDPALEVTRDSVLVLGGAGPGGRTRHARVGPRARSGAARGGRRRRHGAGHRWAHERHGVWHLRAARDPRGGDRRPARTGARRRPGRARRARRDARPRGLGRRAGRARGRGGSRRARPHLRGWPALYQAHVTQADQGCDFDFLQALPAARGLVEPVIGRS